MKKFSEESYLNPIQGIIKEYEKILDFFNGNKNNLLRELFDQFSKAWHAVPKLENDSVVLDVGCGSGFKSFLMALNPSVKKVVAFDPSLDTKKIETIKDQLVRDGYQEFEKIEFIQGDISDVTRKYPSQKFDAVFVFN